jgi:hypothetical protein
VFGQAADGTDITGLSFQGITVESHIFDESNTQRRHVNPFWRAWLIIPGKGWIFDGRSALRKDQEARKSGNKPNQADDPVIHEAD